MLSFFQQKTEKNLPIIHSKIWRHVRELWAYRHSNYQISKSRASRSQVQMNPHGFLWWRLGKKANKPAAVITQKPDHTLIRIFASPTQLLKFWITKGQVWHSTSKAGHGEQIGRCTAKLGAATNCVLWILTKKKRRRKRLGITEGKKWRMLLSSPFSFICLYDAHSKALKHKYTSMYMFPQVRDHI